MQAHKVNSYAMMVYPTCGVLFGVGYVLCMHVHHHDFLVGRFSIFMLAFTLYKAGILFVHPLPLNLVLPLVSTIPTYIRYFIAVLSKFACAISKKIQNYFLFCVPVSLMKR